MPTSPCPCWPWPGSRPARPRRKRGHRHQRPGHDRLHAPGDPPAADQPGPGRFARPPRRLVLVPLAPATPVPGPAMPLPATRLCSHLSAVAVLSVSHVPGGIGLRPRQRRPEETGVLVGHTKRGRSYLPPMRELGVTTVDWVRDDLPDLLWPVLLLAEQGS